MVRTNFTEAMKRTMYEWFFETYDQMPTVYDQILDVREATSGAFDQSTSAIGAGKLSQVDEGENIPHEELMEGFTTYCAYKKFAQMIHLTQETVEDNTKTENMLRDLANNWAQSVNFTLEAFYATAFNRGGFTAGDSFFNQSIPGILTYPGGQLGYDSQPIFCLTGNEHTSKGGGTYVNSLNVTLSPENLEAAYIKLMAVNNRNERDEIVSLGNDLVLVCAPQLAPTAERIVKSDKLSGSNNNDVNIFLGKITIVPWTYITNSSAWYLGVRKKGLCAYKRRAPKIDFYYDEDVEVFKAKISMRYGFMEKNWRYWVAGKTATS